MKNIILALMILFIAGCSSPEYKIESPSGLETPNYKYVDKLKDEDIFHVNNKEGGASAAANAALAIGVGVIKKNKFECLKECESELKKSIYNRTNK